VTGKRDSALAVPIEALVVRDPAKQARLADRKGRRAGRSRTARDDGESGEDGQDGGAKEVEGVFVDRAGTAEFVAVTVGIAGEKHFEVLEGLAEGDRVVRGPFEALRRLETGDRIRVEKDKSRRGARRAAAAGDEDEEGETGSDGEEGT
jgi:HlyD family secretion protein